MTRQMNAAQKYLVSSAYGEFLPDTLRDGDHYAEIDECHTALLGLTFELGAIAAGLKAAMNGSAGS